MRKQRGGGGEKERGERWQKTEKMLKRKRGRERDDDKRQKW